MLEDGGMVFNGAVDDAISRYMVQCDLVSAGRIIDHIRWTKPYIHIERIIVNDTECDDSIVKAGQATLDIQIEGKADISFLTDLIVEFRNMMDVLLATFAAAGI